MKPLIKWLALVAVFLLALMQYGCKDRPVQIGTSHGRSA